MQNNLKGNEPIMGPFSFCRPVYFFSGGENIFFDLPFINTNDLNSPEPGAVTQNPIIINTNSLGNQNEQYLSQSSLVVLTEQSLQTEIEKNNIEYIIIGGQYRWLALYFLNHPDFVKVADFKDGDAQIFKVVNKEMVLVHPEPVLGEDVIDFLQAVKQQQPQRYQWFIDTFFSGLLGFSELEEAQLFSNGYPVERFGQDISIDRFIQWVTQNEKLDKVIEIQKQKAVTFSDNPWVYINLGNLFGAKGDWSEALKSYQHAVSVAVNPDEILPYINISVDKQYLVEYLAEGETYQTPLHIEDVEGKNYIATTRLLNQFDLAQTTYENSFQDVRRSSVVINKLPKGVLFEHPTSKTDFTIKDTGFNNLIPSI